MEVKHIDVISAGKIMGIISAAFGLLAGLLMFLAGSMFGSLMGAENGGGFMAIGGVMGIVVLPILYGIFGFIAGIIQAFIYNIASGWVGGLRIRTE